MSDMRILITADVNRGLSIGEINRSIKAIQNHPSLQSLKLKIDIDQKILQTLQQFNANLNRVNQSMGQQSSVTEQASKAAKSNASAIQSETNAINEQTQALQNNQVMKQKIVNSRDKASEMLKSDVFTTKGNKFDSTTTHETIFEDGSRSSNPDNSTQFLNPEALRESETNLKRFTENSSARLRELRKQIGNNNSEVKILKNELAQLSVTSNRADFSSFNDKLSALEKKAKITVKGFEEMDEILSNVGKETSKGALKDAQLQADFSQKAQLQEYDRKLKLTEQQAKIENGYIKDIDRAHHDAFLEKERRESHLGSKLIQDRVRAYDVARIEDNKFNQQRFVNEQKFARMQQETINKIEIARMKYGQHKGVNEQLDAALFTAQSVKHTDDFNNALRNVNTTVTKTTAGLKAARSTSLGFGEAFSTAMVKFPIKYLGGKKTSLTAGISLEPIC